jgi:cation diffusion facilitator family transporter
MGLKFFRRPADERFHFGYFKIENLASIAAAAVMITLATYITLRSYNQLVDPQGIELPLLGAFVAMIAAVIAWVLGIKKYLDSRTSNMGSVRLDAFNTIKDGSASFLAVVALILSSQGYHVADAIVGFVIAGIIITIGFAAIKESSLILVDACDGVCIQRGLALRLMAENLEGVFAARVVRLRRTGPVFQGEMDIAVSPDMPVSEFDRIRSQIQTMARDMFPEIERLSVASHPHVEGVPDFDDKPVDTR